MKIIDESISLVIPGNWNRHILTPNWVAKNIFQIESIQVEFAINGTLPPRYTHDKIRFIPHHSRITFIALDINESTFESIEKMSIRLLELLPHTPTNSFGINFQLIETEINPAVLTLFKFDDNAKIIDSCYTDDCDIIESSIIRKIKLNDRDLNFTIVNKTEHTEFNCNFHYNLVSPLLINNSFSSNYKILTNLINKTYGLPIEMGGE